MDAGFENDSLELAFDNSNDVSVGVHDPAMQVEMAAVCEDGPSEQLVDPSSMRSC